MNGIVYNGMCYMKHSNNTLLSNLFSYSIQHEFSVTNQWPLKKHSVKTCEQIEIFEYLKIYLSFLSNSCSEVLEDISIISRIFKNFSAERKVRQLT